MIRSCTLALCSLALLAGGCEAIFMRRFVKPKKGADLRGERVLVIPFKEGGWYGESPFGNKISGAIKNALDKNCERASFLEQQAEREALTRVLEWYEEGEPPWSLFGEQAGVDMIIVGKVQEISFRTQNLVGMLHGRLRIGFKVWDVAENKFTWESNLVYSFPEDPEHGKIIPSFEQNHQQIEDQLVVMACEDIVKVCCGKIEDLRD